MNILPLGDASRGWMHGEQLKAIQAHLNVALGVLEHPLVSALLLAQRSVAALLLRRLQAPSLLSVCTFPSGHDALRVWLGFRGFQGFRVSGLEKLLKGSPHAKTPHSSKAILCAA